MNKSSILKIITALTIASLYIFMFGFMGVIEPIDFYAASNELATSPDLENPDLTETDAQTLGEEETQLIKEDAQPQINIDVFNGIKPGLADYNNPWRMSSSQVSINFENSDASENNSLVLDDPDAYETEAASETKPVTETEPPTSEPPKTEPVTEPEKTETEPPVTEPEKTETEPPVTEQPTAEPEKPEPASEKLSVMNNGNEISGEALDVISRIVQSEMGSAFHREALKAQAVASYTYVKRQNALGVKPNVPIASTASEKVRECVAEVIGKGIYYNGSLIQAVYCASSAGYTASAKRVWNDDLPYLRSVKCSFDEKYDPNFGRTAVFSSNEIMLNVLKHTGIELSGEPSGWLKILNYVDDVYVGEMSIGGATSYSIGGEDYSLTGRSFREKIMNFDLRSSAFSVVYNQSKDEFTFTTYGYGHGAGMSQNGANILAMYYDYNYIDILKHYYMGVEVR